MNLKKTKLENGMEFWFLVNDKYIGQRVALGKYEPYLTRLMLDQIKTGDLVVDVGANIGFDALTFSAKVGNNGKVYAFEPEETNYSILEKNIKGNGIRNIEAIRAAAGSKEGTIKLYKSKENMGDHRLFGGKSNLQNPISKQKPNHNFPKREIVKITRLDDYLKEIGEERKIDLLKIDTQGWEPEVIKGAENLIRKYKPIIFFEYSPEMYKLAGLKAERMVSFLMEVYGEIYYIDEYIQVYYPIKNIKRDCNLWVSDKKDIEFYRGMVKDFWPKKLIKRWLGRPAT